MKHIISYLLVLLILTACVPQTREEFDASSNFESRIYQGNYKDLFDKWIACSPTGASGRRIAIKDDEAYEIINESVRLYFIPLSETTTRISLAMFLSFSMSSMDNMEICLGQKGQPV